MTGEGGIPPRPPAPDAGGGAPRRRRRWPLVVAACVLLLVFSIGGCMAVAVNNYFKESRESNPMNTPPTERQLQIARDLGRSELVLKDMEKGWVLSDEAVAELGFGAASNHSSITEAEAAIDYLRERYGEEFAVTKINHTPELLDRSYGFLAHATTGGHADEEFRVKFGVQNREPGDPEVWAYWDSYLTVSRGDECEAYVTGIIEEAYRGFPEENMRITVNKPRVVLYDTGIDPNLPVEEMAKHLKLEYYVVFVDSTIEEDEYYRLLDKCVVSLRDGEIAASYEFFMRIGDSSLKADDHLPTSCQQWIVGGTAAMIAEERGL